LGLAALFATPLAAQYTFRSRANQSIIFETGENAPDGEDMRKRVDDAPWKLGVLHLAPSLGFRDARFVSNQGSLIQTTDEPIEDRTDFTATLSAGLRAYMKTGNKVIWTVHGIPEYVWWQDDAARRRFNGRYGAGVFAFFNKLSLEASHRQVEEQTFFSPEVEQLTTVRLNDTRLYASLEVARGISFFISATQTDFASDEDAAAVLSNLDRKRQLFRTGLRFTTRGGWTFGLGYEDGMIEFDGLFGNGLVDRSNDASAELVEVSWEGNRFELDVSAAFRSLEPRPGSSFIPTDETTGDISLLVKLTSHFSFSAYALQELSFSVLDTNSHFLTQRQGILWTYDSGRERGRVTIDFFAETGQDEFSAFALAGGAERIDDADTFGGNISFYLRKNLLINVGGLKSTFDSSFDPEDRDVSTFGFNLSYNFTDALDRIGLRLGSSGGSGW
jgi:hypothetical protein